MFRSYSSATRSDKGSIKQQFCSKSSKHCETARNVRKRESEDETQKNIRNNIEQMSVIKAQNDVVTMQLQLCNKNKEAYITAFGEAEYNSKIIDLLNKLSDPRVGCENDEEEENDEVAATDPSVAVED